MRPKPRESVTNDTDAQSSCAYPGAAGARKLAYRAPGAIIIGGGCEFVLVGAACTVCVCCNFVNEILQLNARALLLLLPSGR